MSLANQLSWEFTSRIRNRGHQYFRSRRVKVLSSTSTRVDAVVRGSSNYSVRITLREGALAVACTCPYFTKGEECKHIWSTILEADRSRLLPEANSQRTLSLDFDFKASEELQKVEEVEDDAAAFSSSPTRVVNEALNMLRARRADKFPRVKQTSPPPKPVPPPEPAWKKHLSELTHTLRTNLSGVSSSWPTHREIVYLIDAQASRTSGSLTVEIGYRERTMKGEWGKVKSQRIPIREIPSLKDASDRQILSTLAGAKEYIYYYGYSSYESLFTRYALTPEQQEFLLPMMCATGRCHLKPTERAFEMQVVELDPGSAWKLRLVFSREKTGSKYALRGVLQRNEEKLEVSSAILVIDRLLIGPDYRLAKLETQSARTWAQAFNNRDALRVPLNDIGELLGQLLEMPSLPEIDLPEDLQIQKLQVPPIPHLMLRKPQDSYYSPQKPSLEAELLFDYEGTPVGTTNPRSGVYHHESRRILMRDHEAERAAFELLQPLGVKGVRGYNDKRALKLSPKNLPRLVSTLLDKSWKVEAEGKLYRNPSSMNMSVSSGIDWFELHGVVEFGDGLEAKLPALLRALQRGEMMVQLDDGSFGLLPDDWLKRYGLLASLGDPNEDHLRFKRTQTGVLDALLAAQPEITFDEVFKRVRDEWRNFKGIKPLSAPKTFVGKLRDYQREGLGWFEFLERFGFGGCLADDMGLGKTIQVLALLEARRVAGAGVTEGPSLVVVPRSLVFNWQQEAARFTPKLRVLIHSGVGRTKDSAHFESYDLVITTYGTLRRDAVHFRDAEFDLVILDEAQAIKNAKTESAKAARLLKGKHRLALSGTPIENHLGELWSLFEFLNPGMLGAASVFQLSANGTRSPNEETRALLSRALRPFILRRTKQQVAKDLPEKLEQTIYCELEPAQRKQYNELRDYYRHSLLDQVQRVGIKRAKIQILEALLRLRQAACHPALISKKGEGDPSAKLDVLIPRLSEVVEEGHKALVFSQFTSFLAIVKARLDEKDIVYEYLDGKTRDRGARVDRFQNDPDCRLFLISLKAGGQGLNLTAAEYVFLLDPWWNPAVEAQAIDRAHRIGQSNRVFAYRLIARDTVEEKVLALQEKKRDLAEAIISADTNLIRNLTGEDLMLLLS